MADQPSNTNMTTAHIIHQVHPLDLAADLVKFANRLLADAAIPQQFVARVTDTHVNLSLQPTNPETGGFDPQPGMTLRDWFAGREVIEQSEIFNWPLIEALVGPRPRGNYDSNPVEWFHWNNLWQAKVKFARADAMLAARNTNTTAQ
jgi:hypothetical protein